MFYDRFAYLCKQKGVSPSRAALDAGISKSLVTKWKNNNTEIPSPDVLNKLSKYFGIPVSELLDEKVPAESSKRPATKEEVIFALFRGREDITDSMYEEIQNFADYIAQREDARKKKEAD